MPTRHLQVNDPDFKFPFPSDLCKVLVNRKGGVFIRYTLIQLCPIMPGCCPYKP